jgi:hypothetical protein
MRFSSIWWRYLIFGGEVELSFIAGRGGDANIANKSKSAEFTANIYQYCGGRSGLCSQNARPTDAGSTLSVGSELNVMMN